MPSANALRIQIERSLQNRFPAALTPMPRSVRETASVGVPQIDALLTGGLPIGAICELVGPSTSGRTCLALSFLAERTAEGKVCAWIDASDALDPESAAASGVHLRQLLWVRCKTSAQPAIGKRPAWPHLDQALRATDLLLQAGGFSAIVLDIGDTPEEHSRRIPLATWYRFRQAADQSRTCLIVVANASSAQASAEVVLDCAPLQPTGETVLDGFTFHVELKRQRSAASIATMRKPPASAHDSTWSAPNAWASGAKS